MSKCVSGVQCRGVGDPKYILRQVSYRMPEVLVNAIKERADEDGTSINEVVRKALAQYLGLRYRAPRPGGQGAGAGRPAGRVTR